MNIFKLYAIALLVPLAGIDMAASVSSISQFGNNLQTLLAAAPRIVIKCFLPGCPPCEAAAPFFHELSNEFSGKDILFVEINGKQLRAVTQSLGVSRFPSFIYIKNGSIVDRITGFSNPSAIRQKLLQLIEN